MVVVGNSQVIKGLVSAKLSLKGSESDEFSDLPIVVMGRTKSRFDFFGLLPLSAGLKEILGATKECCLCRLKVGVPDRVQSCPEVDAVDFDSVELERLG